MKKPLDVGSSEEDTKLSNQDVAERNEMEIQAMTDL
jgi:hypothetical protein